ncbi:hypothetical protein [Rickettsiella massiliensis]|uniref:hypothetical protein n=1 Tax=Rickettsiella massiliensis TaxID=676517 RepID=UPI00029A324E|nr:hypothetical protein [Rickettsiella massiliensis]
MLVAYSHPEGLEPLLNFLSDNSTCFDSVLCQEMFSKIDRDGWNVLMLATRYQPKGLEPLLNFLSKQTTCFYQTTYEKLFLQTDKKGWNVLELAVWYHPEKLQLLLSFLPGRAPWLARATQAFFCKPIRVVRMY